MTELTAEKQKQIDIFLTTYFSDRLIYGQVSDRKYSETNWMHTVSCNVVDGVHIGIQLSSPEHVGDSAASLVYFVFTIKN